jgi:hypothetical protein
VKFIQSRERFLDEDESLRQYLMQYIVPILSDGMLELSNTLPEDPIEFMVKLLYFVVKLNSQSIFSVEVLRLGKDLQIIL